MMSAPRDTRVRYSAWDGVQSVEPLSSDAVLDALSDVLLADGVDTSLTRALHQGLRQESGAHIPGLDHLRDHLRAEQRAAVSDLAAELNDESLVDKMAATSDESLRRMLSALRAGATSLAGLLSDAPSDLHNEFVSLVEAASPFDGMTIIEEQIDRLVELGRLECQLRSVRAIHEVDAIDSELLERLLGQTESDAFKRLVGSLRAFNDSGFIQNRGSRAALSARAVQRIGDALLQATLNQLQNRSAGQHQRRNRGQSHEPTGFSRDYEFGDPFELDLGQTVLGAVKRRPGTPVRIDPTDLKVQDREASEKATTILAIDLSRSMGERGYLLAAKKLALALTTFIRTRYPHDELILVGFSESARQLKLQELVDLKWDRYGFGTNVQEALRLAIGILGSHRGRRRNLVVITDGEPTAYRDTSGQVIFSHPPTSETLAHTYREAQRLRRDGIYLCICVMSALQQVTAFGTDLAKRAAGDVIVTDPDHLSADLIVTYSRNRT